LQPLRRMVKLKASVASCHVKGRCWLHVSKVLAFQVVQRSDQHVCTWRTWVTRNCSFRSSSLMHSTLQSDFIAVDKYFQQRLPFASWNFTSNIQFGNFVLRSKKWVKPGDQLGPLYFCLVCKELLESLKLEGKFSAILMTSHSVTMQLSVCLKARNSTGETQSHNEPFKMWSHLSQWHQ